MQRSEDSAREFRALADDQPATANEHLAPAMRAAVDMALEPMVFVSTGALEIVAANPAFLRCVKLPWSEVGGASLVHLGGMVLGETFAADFARATLGDEPEPFRLAAAWGEPIDVIVRRVPAATSAGDDLLVVVFRAGAPAPAAFVSPADTDGLTGLANRARLFQVGREWLAQPAETCAALFLDLDGFKAINDQFGHLAGDQVLQATAARLHSCVRPHDFVARYAGDEFVVLLAHVAGRHEVDRICERVVQAVSLPVAWASGSLAVSASVGAAIVGAETLAFEDLLHAADLAMYERKAARGRS